MLLIKNGYMIDPKSGWDGNYDILVENDTIVRIGKRLETPKGKCRIIDAEGLLVAPGLVDVHAHFRDPGFTMKEDIVTGAAAAARGGYTSVVLMANTKPTVDNLDTLKYVIGRGKETGIHVYTCANVTMGMKGKELTPMRELAAAGAVGFTDDGIPLMDEKIVRDAMKNVAALDLPISFHEENPALIENNGVNRGRASEHFGIGGSPREAEITMVGRDLKLALETGASIDIQHVSARETVELIRKAKEKGHNIHAEATPHHFTLTEDAVIKYGTLAKMNPPLREEADRQEIIRGLVDGTIDMIATDHAPHSAEEKAKGLRGSAMGVVGIETAFPLLYTYLVETGKMPLEMLIDRMADAPRRRFRIDGGMQVGDKAAVTVFDLHAREKIDPNNFLSKGRATPFEDWEVHAACRLTICGDKIAYNALSRKE